MHFPLTWNLNSLFTNKGKSEEFESFIREIHLSLDKLEKLDPLDKAFPLAESIAEKLSHALSFVHCLLAEDTKNDHAQLLEEQLRILQARYDNILLLLDQKLKNLDEKDFHHLLSTPTCHKMAFALKERRHLSKEKLPLETESLINDLSIDGYHGYTQIFHLLHSQLQFSYQGEPLSIAQIDNLLSHPDKAVRKEAFASYLKTFSHAAPLFASILNHIGGFRLQVYKKRGWDSILKEPLECNRMKEKTLDSIWHAIEKHLPSFKQFLEKKASLLGIEKISWYDFETPIGSSNTLTPYDKACDIIIDQFNKYSPHMAAFAKHALKNGWVEVENRANKSAGGFCTPLPCIKESRIFMTYSGTQSNIATLAHELGHAYHDHILFSLPYFSQNIKMNVAETASTMAEMMVLDATIESASSKKEKLALLDEKISRALIFFMNIRARFLFEKAFYKERALGYVLPERLSFLMEEAQKEAFDHALGEYHPLFWASKIHFYFTDIPFYNFPYTFGYLFSLGIYDLLKKEPHSFEKKYQDFLKDSGQMTSEDLAQKHFNVDITQTSFWEIALSSVLTDIDHFLKES